MPIKFIAAVILTMGVLGLSSEKAHALIDIRAHYGVQSVADIETALNNPELSQLQGIGGDLIVDLPLIPFIFGLRYEAMKQEEDNSIANIDISLNRTSALFGFRLPVPLIYLGAIATYGLDHGGTNKIDVKSTSGIDFNQDVDVDFSYSVGVEAGLDLPGVPVTLGAEVGYLGMTTNKDTDGETDIDGVYAKAVVGFGF